jgi:hypothetical protein
MFDSPDANDYLQRAEMHETLASTTGDLQARKMHLAMAAEFRRKAAEIQAISVSPRVQAGPRMELAASIR